MEVVGVGGDCSSCPHVLMISWAQPPDCVRLHGSSPPQMQALLPHLWCLISVGAPHLGQLYNGNMLLAAGMGVLKAMRKGVVCIAGHVGRVQPVARQ